MVTYMLYSMGRMEYNWGPDAAPFKPERWLKDGIFKVHLHSSSLHSRYIYEAIRIYKSVFIFVIINP